MDPPKKNDWSIPLTVSQLSRISNPRHLKTAADLIENHKTGGRALIHLGDSTGLSLNAATPVRFRDSFIRAFRVNPKAMIGVTRAHTLVHSIKLLEKHGLVILAVPLALLAMFLSSLPATVLWSILVATVAYLIILTRRKT